MEHKEGEGSTEPTTTTAEAAVEKEEQEDFTEIETNAAYLDTSITFQLINSVAGFVLYMHQQIPSVLEDMSLEFDNLQMERRELESGLGQIEAKPGMRRKHIGRMREVKRGITKLDKLMKTVDALTTALRLVISEVPGVDRVILALGANPIRPHYVYELCFSRGRHTATAGLPGPADFTRTKAAEGLSKRAIRALISKGAGSGASYPGPAKLFLLVKAPCSLNLPLHFVPKREFRYSKKVMPVRLRLKCRGQNLEMGDALDSGFHASCPSGRDSLSDDIIWFQCRHVIKGLPFKIETEE